MTFSDPKSRTHWVWRISSVLLLTLWTLLAAAPFAQAEPDRDASLPACCRTHGAHHCAGITNQTSEAPAFGTPTLHEKCPCTPAAGSSVLLGASACADAAFSDIPAAAGEATRNTLSEANGQDSTHANPKRGPPVSSHLR